MISEEQARRKILATIRPLPTQRLPISQALGCFAAADYLARLPLPAFDNSAMDGYAVVASSCEKGKRLRVIGEQPAGRDKQLCISRGEAVRIFTGAPLPDGADSIVMQEDVKRDGDEITVNADVALGDFIRRRGCDLAKGQKVLVKGEPIRAATIALLASQGFTDVTVGGEVNAAIISTGDEVMQPGEKIEPGQIYDSNSALLHALLRRCGAIVRLAEHCRDEHDALTEAITHGIKNHVLVITGGVSVGEHDLVKNVLHDLGAQIDIWRVAIKPGKPFLFGRVEQRRPLPQSYQRSARSRSRGGGREAPGEGGIAGRDYCFIFGLPGNPVSAFVTFLQFVRPAILKMMGASNLGLPEVPATLAVDVTNDGDRVHYVRGKLEHGEFTPVGRQESHALFGLSQSNALLRLALGQSSKADEIVEVQTWD